MTNRDATVGDRVKCKISGFEGLVTSHARHLAGCDRLFTVPRVDKDGKEGVGQWLDIDMVEITEPNAVEPVVYTRRAPGGVDLPPSR